MLVDLAPAGNPEAAPIWANSALVASGRRDELARRSLAGSRGSMETFVFRGVDRASGRIRHGRLQASSSDEAVERLNREGLRLTRLGVVNERQRWFRSSVDGSVRRSRPATLDERARLARQLGMLLAAGLPLLAGLELLVRQERVGARRAALADLAATVRSGIPLSQGLARGRGRFDPLSVSLIRAGEAAGALDDALLRLARVLEASARLRSRLLAALAYPTLVALVAGVVVGAMLLFVVPRFEQLFLAQFPGRHLPGLTRAVLGLSHFVLQHGLWCAVSVPLLGGVVLWARRQDWCRERWWSGLRRLPLVAQIWQAVWVARWARTLGVLLGAGVPILDALALSRDAVGTDEVLRLTLRSAETRVGAGVPLSRALQEGGSAPATVIALLEVGEATGKVPETLERLADVQDEEVDRAVIMLTALVEPVLMVALALGVGTVVIALFLPMIDLIRALSGG
jgi:type IV pilus assembly protein PilC